MDVQTFSIHVSTKGFTDIIDITNQVQSIIETSDFSEGNVLVFVPGATAGVTTIEYEPGLLKDYPDFMEKIVPSDKNYHHDMTWHDGNGFSHIRASLQGASFQAPFKDKSILLGTWQQIILVDFDNRSRNREVILQIIGKK